MTQPHVDPAELVAPADIAVLFQVTRQAVALWKDIPSFPVPVATVGNYNTPLYLRSEVIDWYQARSRTKTGGEDDSVKVGLLGEPLA